MRRGISICLMMLVVWTGTVSYESLAENEMETDSMENTAPTKIEPCPSSPNCVSSTSAGEAHFIEPFVLAGSDDLAPIRDYLVKQARITVINQTANYLHVEARTRLLRFVDDVEFLLDADGATLHIRSASRVGYSDLGTNRRRLETMRTELVELGVIAGGVAR